MTTAPPFALRARTAEEPEPDLTSIVVIHRAIRQDLARLAACLGQVAAHGAPRSRSHAIWRYTAALLAEIRTHHQNEDEILCPVLAATAGQARPSARGPKSASTVRLPTARCLASRPHKPL